jgi:undecaprenyl-diphosphatase
MSIVQALVLGLLQGLTEFLPVSSSGHLVLFPFIVGWPVPTVAFDVAVHLGTLLSVLWVFRARVVAMLRAAASWSSAPERDRRALKLVVIGTIPAAIVGVVLGSRIEDTFERPVVVTLLLALNGWAMLSGERMGHERPDTDRTEDEMRTSDALGVGAAQAVAILPGISRSGSTIAAGRALGMSRETAAEYSFLLSIPVIAGAGLVKIPDIARAEAGPMIVGIAASAIAGVIALRAFLAFVRARGLRPFAYYCFAATAAGILAALARG